MNQLEKVSEKIHDLWIGWAKEMIKSEPNLSKERIQRWNNECFKPYSELSEEMKDLDRRFAKEIISLIQEDEFLNPTASFERLYREYKKYGSLCIGVDFDGTLYDYHKKGTSYEMVRQLVRDLKSINCKIVIWTANENLNFVESFCKENNIPFDNINGEGIELGWESKKPFFSATLDDRCGLMQVYQELKLLVNLIKQ